MTVVPANRQLNDQLIINQLKEMGFSDDIVETPRRLIVSSSGPTKTGKSNFALTAPGPIVYFDIDIGTEGVVGKFQEAGKQVLIDHIRVPKGGKQTDYLAMWTNFKARALRAYGLSGGTVVWDTGSEAYELCRLARFGRLTQVQPHNYAEVNNEWRDLLRNAYDSEGMNTIFIHKIKAVWMNTTDSNGRLKSTKTNNFELAGFSEMDYLSQINISHSREDVEGGTVFSIHIKDCRQTPSVNGMTLRGLLLPAGKKRVGDPLCNFEMLLSMVHDE